MVKYDQGNRLGDSFHEPVILTQEHGYSYGGTAGDAFDLEDPISLTSKDAVVGAYQYCMSSSISLAAASRAVSGGKQAFASTVSVLLESAYESSGSRLEISCLYGQSGIGDVPDTGATVEVTSTTALLQFSAATWATGIWAGAEGAKLQFYDLDDDALISSSTDAVFTVTLVDNLNKRVTVTGTATGIDALDVAVQAGGVRAYFKGSKTNDMTGLKLILSNTGTLFGISAAAFGLWKGNSFNAAGALTVEKVLAFNATLVGRGAKGDMVLMVSPVTWGSLNAEQSALRMLDSSYSSTKFENGTESIKYHGQRGAIEVVANPMVKEGDAFMFIPKDLHRIGSAERDGEIATQEKNPFYPLASQAGFGFRIFSDQAIHCRRPARAAYISGVINPTVS